jgi:hypothetical protein
MQKTNISVFTVMAIIGSAFVLGTVGCGASSSLKSPPESTEVTAMDVRDDQLTTEVESRQKKIKELAPSEITRECTTEEFSNLKVWRNLLNESNTAIDNMMSKKNEAALKSAKSAVKSCDNIVAHHATQPCRKNFVTGDIKYYDQSRLLKDCKKSTEYLIQHDDRPVSDSSSAPRPPQTVVKPPVSTPPPTAPARIDSLKQCSSDEFSKLSQYSSAQSVADSAITKLGSVANWKYDGKAISSAALATKACEGLIQYHQKNPCEKSIIKEDGSKGVRQYTAESLAARCQTARTYFYEYVQNTKTLIFPNADLYLDFSALRPQIFESGFSDQVSGNCIVENRTERTIDYTNSKALVIDTRGFESKMLVMQTAEGLLVQCYGLNIDGPFSKREIVKVLNEEQSDIRLLYQLK